MGYILTTMYDTSLKGLEMKDTKAENVDWISNVRLGGEFGGERKRGKNIKLLKQWSCSGLYGTDKETRERVGRSQYQSHHPTR